MDHRKAMENRGEINQGDGVLMVNTGSNAKLHVSTESIRGMGSMINSGLKY